MSDSLFDVSWSVVNPSGEIYSALVPSIKEAAAKFGDKYVTVGPDLGQADADQFVEEVWNRDVFEALSALPFACRMGRWLAGAKSQTILIKLDRLLQQGEALTRYNSALGAGPGKALATDRAAFAYGAALVVERLHTKLHGPRGIRTSVRCHEWSAMPTVLALKERAPEVGAIFTAAAGAPVSAPRMLHVDVLPTFPEALSTLRELLQENLWWGWTSEAIGLVRDLDPALWLTSRQDPDFFFRRLRPEALTKAAASREYLDRLAQVNKSFRAYLAEKKPTEIAYFCMEFGLSAALRLYSGGLGILAGDHLKTASDLNIPLCAIGLAYRQGYFKQVISAEGQQEAHYEYTDFGKTFSIHPAKDAAGKQVRFTVDVPGRKIHVQAWRVAVGRVDLFLLDTDLPENKPQDRRISDRLYGGDNDHRLVQEWILSGGGLKLLELVGIKPKVFHMNEGHTSFVNLFRLEQLVKREGLSFADAVEYMRHSTIFTTHTPVPAGHDRFSESALKPYIKPLADSLGVETSRLHNLGVDPGRPDSTSFSTTAMCVRTAERVNGVSAIHGEVSRRMFQSYYPGYTEGELPVTSITNGVHPGTWIAPQFQDLFTKELGNAWRSNLANADYWAKFRNVDSQKIWDVHMRLKDELIQWLKQYLTETWTDRQTELAKALAILDTRPFIATYARRFATYKRPALILKDLERLRRVLDAKIPVVFIYAGKAHPMDRPGKDVIREVNDVSRMPEFAGKVLFVENYDMDKAAKLVRGSDIWVNNPIRPLEASGTSGMKAAMNGCLNLSVPDGWWAEGYNGKNGWTIGEPSLDQPTKFQEVFDSTQIYLRLEQEVLPCYAARNSKGMPEAWVEMMKESIATLTPAFSTDRMLLDYDRMFYKPAIEDARSLKENGYARLKQIGEARERLTQRWEELQVVGVQTTPADIAMVTSDQPLRVSVQLRHPKLQAQELFVQALVAHRGAAGGYRTVPMTVAAGSGDTSQWNAQVQWEQAGETTVGVRISPRNPLRSEPDYDLNLVKWL